MLRLKCGGTATDEDAARMVNCCGARFPNGQSADTTKANFARMIFGKLPRHLSREKYVKVRQKGQSLLIRENTGRKRLES